LADTLQTGIDILRSGTALVTGGGGFVGRNLIQRLLDQGVDVTVLARNVGPRLSGLEKKIRLVQCELEDADGLMEALRRFRFVTVFHLAAAVRPTLTNATIINANVLGTANLLAAVQDHPLKQFVLVGSGFEYGAGGGLQEQAPLRPNNIYGATKAAAHLIAHVYRRNRGLPIISMRPFTPYGPWEASWRLVPFTICRGLDQADIPLTEGRQQRDYVYVGDVAEALIRAIALPGNDDVEAINICSGRPTTIKAIVTEILRTVGGTGKAHFGALPYRDGEMWLQSGDPAQARELLGWTASTGLSDGLQQTIEWIKDNRRLVETLV